MAAGKNSIIYALDVIRQLYTWDSKLHKDPFTRHLRHLFEQSKLTAHERKASLLLVENLLYIINDEYTYVDYDDSDVFERIYHAKSSLNSDRSPIRRGVSKEKERDEPEFQRRNEKDIAEELLQLKIRLHEEILSVKNDIKVCKKYIHDQFTVNHVSPRQQALAWLSTPRQQTPRTPQTPKTPQTPRSNGSLSRSSSINSLSLNPTAKSSVKRRGSQTSLYDELNQSREDKDIVNILLGDGIFEQISGKRLISNGNQHMVAFCKSTFTLETGFEKLTDYIISNPFVEITRVCVLLGSNNLAERKCLPTELALTTLSYVKDLQKRVSGNVFLYAIPPRLDDVMLDRKTTHYNNQLAAALHQSNMPHVFMVKNVIPREASCFQNGGIRLAGPGINKLMRAVRKNLNKDPTGS